MAEVMDYLSSLVYIRLRAQVKQCNGLPQAINGHPLKSNLDMIMILNNRRYTMLYSTKHNLLK